MERLLLMAAPVAPVGPTLRVAQAFISSRKASYLLGIGRPCGGLRSSERWSWFCGWAEDPGVGPERELQNGACDFFRGEHADFLRVE